MLGPIGRLKGIGREHREWTPAEVCGFPGPSAAADEGPAPSFEGWKYPGVGATRPQSLRTYLR